MFPIHYMKQVAISSLQTQVQSPLGPGYINAENTYTLPYWIGIIKWSTSLPLMATVQTQQIREERWRENHHRTKMNKIIKPISSCCIMLSVLCSCKYNKGHLMPLHKK